MEIYLIIDLYKKSENEFHIINPEAVRRNALRRYTTRIRAKLQAKLKKAQIALARSIHQGYEHTNNTINKKLQPVAFIEDDCAKVTWHPTVHKWLARAGAEEHDTITPTFTPNW